MPSYGVRHAVWVALFVCGAMPVPAGSTELVDVRVDAHAGFTRIVFELDGPAGHGITRRAVAGGGAELDVALAVTASARRQPLDDPRVRLVTVEPQGPNAARVRILLSGSTASYRETVLANPDRILVDIIPPPEAQPPERSAGSGPSAPQALPRAEDAASSASILDLRVGHHPGYSRVVLELDARPSYHLEQMDAEVQVTLAARSPRHFQTFSSGPIASVSVEPGADDSGSTVRIHLRSPRSRVREEVFSDPDRLVFDVSERATAAELPVRMPSEPVEPRNDADVALTAPPATPSDGSDAEPRFRRPGGPLPPPKAVALADDASPRPLRKLDYDWVDVPDRWRLVEALEVNEHFWDPYDQSTLKGDRPILGTQDWFLNLSLVSDTVVEPRRLPTPVGAQANRRSGSLDIFGDGTQLAVNQNLIFSTALIKGDTVFQPPDYEFRMTGVGNFNHLEVDTLGVTRIDPTRGYERNDWHFGFQELFVDKHLWNKSDRYDFDSLRSGIQPITADFRGFLFLDEPLGGRLFGTFEDNRIQYNLGWFRRIEKDTNSGLNELFDLRRDDVLLANAYYQDFPVLGFTLQGLVAYNRNREGDESVHRNENGFQERPAPVGAALAHNYDVVYLGLNGDGHLGRLNLNFSNYAALGHDTLNPIAQRSQEIRAWFSAAEASLDFDWYRLKGYGLYASGDNDPYDGRATGFDAILENPNFAGAETSFWVRQAIPFIGGGGVVLSGRNGLLPSLRSSKEEGQSNFVNPGLWLAGVGADFDVLPELRLLANASWLSFVDVSSLRALRVQGPIGREIGWDLSAGLVYRPLFIQNVVLRTSGAVLLPGAGLKDLFALSGSDSPLYSVLVNVVLTY